MFEAVHLFVGFVCCFSANIVETSFSHFVKLKHDYMVHIGCSYSIYHAFQIPKRDKRRVGGASVTSLVTDRDLGLG